MADLKHVGRIVRNKRKVIVAYRVVPNEPENCIVITTENLQADEHDTLMKLIESDAGQNANELAEVMARTRLPDGRIMLSAFHATGKMVKLSTSEVEMTPNMRTSVLLKDLNEAIAQQKGVSVSDLALQGPTVKKAPENTVVNTAEETVTIASVDSPLSDEALAAQYRSQADAMFKEAKRLREQAEELAPTKKLKTSAQN